MNNLAKKNFFWNAIGLTLYGFNSLIMMIIITRINGLAISGIYSYAFSLCCLFYLISIFYNRTHQISYEDNKYDIGDLFWFRVISSILSIVLIIIFSLINKFDSYKCLIIILIMVLKCIDAFSDYFHGNIHKNNKLYLVGISLTIKSFIGLSLFFVVDKLTNNLVISLITYILVNAIIMLIYDVKNFRIDYKKDLIFRKEKLIYIFKDCVSIFLFSFIANLLYNCQKLLLTYFTSNEIQSIFGIILMPATMVGLISSYLINPFINSFTKYRDQKDSKKFNKLLLELNIAICGGGILCVLAAYLLGIPVLNFVYNLNLNEYKVDLLIILFGSIFMGMNSIFSSCLTVLNQNKSQLLIYVIDIVISFVISYLLISKYLINGAVYSYLVTSISLFILFLILYFITIRKEEKKWKKQ